MLRPGWTRPMQALAVSVLAVVMLGAADPSARFGRLGHQMICQCGCAQVLLDCNHVGCPVSPVMISELNTRLDGGGTDTSIFNWFIAKYGAPVLAAPIRGGFDNVAWITPIAVFLMATVGTAFLIRVWKLRGTTNRPAAATGGGDLAMEAMRERIRRETEY